MGRLPIPPSASSAPSIRKGPAPPPHHLPPRHPPQPPPPPSSPKASNTSSPVLISTPTLDFAAPSPGFPTDLLLPVYFKITSASTSPLTTHCPLRLSEALKTALGTDNLQAR